jgi:hypothetical protein
MTSKDRWRARAASTFLVGPLIAGALAFVSLAFGSLAFGPAAHAQLPAPQDTTIDAQLWQPAIGPRNFITVENTAVPEHKMFGLGLSLNYQRRPYILYTQGYTMGQDRLWQLEFFRRATAGRLAEFEALFIRETTQVNHHTYRFSRRAAAEKLPALRVPVSTPLGRMSRWVLAERLPRTLPAITMAAALMLASTWAASPTITRPVTSISPSKRP